MSFRIIKYALLVFIFFCSHCLSAQIDQSTDINLSKENVVVFGENTGKISFKLTKGQRPFEYTWSQQNGELNGNGILNLIDREISIRDLPAGKYDLVIVDARSQVIFDNVVIIAIAAVEVLKTSAMEKPNVRSEPASRNLIKKETVKLKPKISSSTTVEQKMLEPPRRPEKLIAFKTIYFKADSSRINAKSSLILSRLFKSLIKTTIERIEISGHTNGNPGISDLFCERLALRRAQEVQSYIEQKIPYEFEFKTVSKGKNDPIADNHSISGRQKNQRVVLQIFGTKHPL